MEGQLRRSLVNVLTVGLALFFISYALATTMNISGVTFLGGVQSQVSAPNVSGVSWVLQRQGNRWMVVGVSLTFDQDLPAGSTIYIDLLDSSGNTIAYGSLTLSNSISKGQPVTVTTNPAVLAQQIASIAISLAGPSL